MKKSLFILLIGCLFFIGNVVILKEYKKPEVEEKQEQIISGSIGNSDVSSNQEAMNSLLKHIGFAEEALSKFQVDNAEEAVNLWAQGIISGNGVLQYAVMDKNLQEEFKLYLQDMENLSWDTRNEERKIEGYEIEEYSEVSEKVKIYKVRFDYINEQGIKTQAYNHLTIVEEMETWVLSSIR